MLAVSEVNAVEERWLDDLGYSLSIAQISVSTNFHAAFPV